MANPYQYSTFPEVYIPGDTGGYPPPTQPSSTSTDAGSQPLQTWDPTICCVCKETSRDVEVWACAQCQASFCDACWPGERAHAPRRIFMPGFEHEKATMRIINRYNNIFIDPTREEQIARHGHDMKTTWFGVFKEGDQPFLHYSNRIVDILQESQTRPHVEDCPERYPLLVSFVGQTSAGKSTIIKMLIKHEEEQLGSVANYPAPVPGIIEDEIPTSGNVHLYADPGTDGAQTPILYADCEGTRGGDELPKAIASGEEFQGRGTRHYVGKQLRKPLTWADSPKRKSREYAVKTLFPRILYTFSDVVVFTLSEVRTFSTEVLQSLVNWASISFDKSLNQPSLPHVIIVLNATESGINDTQWDTEKATDLLLGAYEDSVHKVPLLMEILEKLQLRGKEMKTTKELLEYYYSSVSVIRLPRKHSYMRLEDQVRKLYGLIREKCMESFKHKASINIMLNAERLPQYVNAAYDHFSKRLHVPFDFAEEARRHTPLPKGFEGHILNLILSLYNKNDREVEDAKGLLEDLSHPIASCVMLAATRDNINGSYSVLLKNTYRDPLQKAFKKFCDRWLRCSYERDGHQCCNARSSHNKGHQAVDGKSLGRGPYKPAFDVDWFFNEWVKHIERHIDWEDKRLQRGAAWGQKKVAARHKEIIAMFYSRTGSASVAKSHATCLCCIREIPENVLPCGHVLCKACVQSFGRNMGRGVFELSCCPLHPGETRWLAPDRIRFKPPGAGVRVLCLDGGGVRGIVELAILQAIEEALGGQIQIQNFFDLIVGTSTGGIIALGLGVKRWSVGNCTYRFKTLCQEAFTPHGSRMLRGVSLLGRKSYYKTPPLEGALQSAFGSDAFLYGQYKPPSTSMEIRVAVVSTNAVEKKAAVLSNYTTVGDRETLPYGFVRPQDPLQELKVWEAARATAAAPPYFKPFTHSGTMSTYTDGALHHNNPVAIADQERKELWQEVRDWPPDILLSLGTGLSSQVAANTTSSPRPHYGSQGNYSGVKVMWWTGTAIVENLLDCEDSWNYYCARAPPDRVGERRRNLRINVGFDVRPKLDDVKDLERIERQVQNSIAEDHRIRADIHEAAHRLVASSFYFEKDKVTPNRGAGIYECTGDIRCRFDEDSQDAKGIGHVLRKCVRGNRFIPSFLLEENYGTVNVKAYEVRLSIEDINRMCDSGVFSLPTQLTIQAFSEASVTRLSLRLQKDFYYSWEDDGLLAISGFPRRLWQTDQSSSLNDEGEDGDEAGAHELAAEGVKSQSVPEGLNEAPASSPSNLGRMFRLPTFGRSAPGGLASMERTASERTAESIPSPYSRPGTGNASIVEGIQDIGLDDVSHLPDYRPSHRYTD